MWLDRFGRASKVAPYVQRNLELTEWELKAVTDCPDKAKESFPDSIGDAIDRDKEFVEKVLPIMPNYDEERIYLTSAVTSSGTVIINDFIYQTVILGTPEAKEYSEKYTGQYQKLQESHDLPKEVRSLIEKLKNSEVLRRFDEAEKTYWLLKAGPGKRTQLALELRTLLEGIQGYLFELARKTPKENMTWQIMADRLSKEGLGSIEHSVMLQQESIRSVLINDLSIIAKDREGKTLRDIENVRAKVLDHVSTILKLVNIKPL